MTGTLPRSNIKFLIEGLEIRKQIYTDSFNFWQKQQHKNPNHLKQIVQQLINEEKLKIDLINSILEDIRNELY